ncbi:hypothetical protein NQ317_014838 [Molorchus minor]|uniref:DNA2/NAM7 helicase helicase domain-containing protein n=1 Tax=Molorchus minor TaxID=1323400 RepID=A0ABQ9JTI8_9CUCU|nr:hypothetical protein NQ317_014838 [Molorchus minor]
MSFKYENSKLFMFGSLVCFSRDKFRNVIFGRIVKRDTELLKNGELIVGFDNIEDISFNTDYVMIESSVYFEPYYHVLTALQRMSLEQFPMERYLIYTEGIVYAPSYLTQNVQYTVENRIIYPLYWDVNRPYYGLNDSQLDAFKAALTQEISGPGTGKTFIGLKIAQTLLENKDAWYRHSPMLVICYTNHALDQFLEGILQFTKRIVRIGQSKNEVMDKYNMRNSKRSRKSEAFYQIQRELKLCLSDLKTCDTIIGQILQYNSVIDFSLFKKVIPNYNDTWFATASKEDIKKWLLVELTGRDIEVKPTTPIAKTPSIDENKDLDSDDESLSDDNDRYVEVDDIFKEVTAAGNLESIISLKSIKSEMDLIERKINLPHGAFNMEVLQYNLYQLQLKYTYLEAKLEQVSKPSEFLNLNIQPQLMTPKTTLGLIFRMAA